MKVQQVARNIRLGLTMTGQEVAGVFGDEATLVRDRLSEPFRELQRDCVEMGENSAAFAEVVSVACALLTERENPAHFGDWKPGLFTEWGEPVPGTDRACVSDVVGYGLTGPNGTAGFLVEAGLPLTTSYLTICTAALMALIEEAVQQFEAGNVWHGAHIAEQAAGMAVEMQAVKLAPELQRAEKFKPKGRGKGKLYKFLDKFITKKNGHLSARELWQAAASSAQARRLGFEFIGETQLWIDGEGQRSFATFENQVGAVKKARRTPKVTE